MAFRAERCDARRALLATRENSFEAFARAWPKPWAGCRLPRCTEDVMVHLEQLAEKRLLVDRIGLCVGTSSLSD